MVNARQRSIDCGTTLRGCMVLTDRIEAAYDKRVTGCGTLVRLRLVTNFEAERSRAGAGREGGGRVTVFG